MVSKPSILIGITKQGVPECLAISMDADEIKQAFFNERDNPSGKYVYLYAYRKPLYWKRRELGQIEQISGDEPSSVETGVKSKNKR